MGETNLTERREAKDRAGDGVEDRGGAAAEQGVHAEAGDWTGALWSGLAEGAAVCMTVVIAGLLGAWTALP